MENKKDQMVWNDALGIYMLPKEPKLFKRHISFSENGNVAYGKASDFNNVDEFIFEVNHQYHEEICLVENIRVEPCISTMEGVGAESIIPLSNTDVVIENYFVADVSEIGIAGKERE